MDISYETFLNSENRKTVFYTSTQNYKRNEKPLNMYVTFIHIKINNSLLKLLNYSPKKIDVTLPANVYNVRSVIYINIYDLCNSY